MASIINLVPQNDLDQLHQFKLKTDRFYCIQNQGWYFHCRDSNQGPFNSKVAAELALSKHIKEQNN